MIGTFPYLLLMCFTNLSKLDHTRGVFLCVSNKRSPPFHESCTRMLNFPFSPCTSIIFFTDWFPRLSINSGSVIVSLFMSIFSIGDSKVREHFKCFAQKVFFFIPPPPEKSKYIILIIKNYFLILFFLEIRLPVHCIKFWWTAGVARTAEKVIFFLPPVAGFLRRIRGFLQWGHLKPEASGLGFPGFPAVSG